MLDGHLTPLPSWRFEPGKCEETLLAHFKTSTLDGFGLKGQSLAVRAAGAILQYLKETQPDSLNLLTGFRHYSLDEFMTLDAATRRNLEFEETLRGERKGSLLGVLDETVTPMGKRLMNQWVSQPLLQHRKDQEAAGRRPVLLRARDGTGRGAHAAQAAGRSRTPCEPNCIWSRPTQRVDRGAGYAAGTSHAS